MGRLLLVLDGVPATVALQSMRGMSLRFADGPLAAAKVVSERAPDAVLVGADTGWQRAFLSSLDDERRPAVVAVGRAAVKLAPFADEWLSDARDAVEVEARLEVALVRARRRRHTVRRGFVDFVSGLPNRRALIRSLVKQYRLARRLNRPLSLVLLDLDRLKLVNDLHGHVAGDRLLRRVGAALRRVTRATELAARVNGDEFALVVPATALEASAVARRVDVALREGCQVEATLAVCERQRWEHLREFYRRADDQLRAGKRLKPSGAKAREPAAPPVRLGVVS